MDGELEERIEEWNKKRQNIAIFITFSVIRFFFTIYYELCSRIETTDFSSYIYPRHWNIFCAMCSAIAKVAQYNEVKNCTEIIQFLASIEFFP